MHIKILSDDDREQWDGFVDSHPKGSYTHLTGYGDVLEGVHNYQPLYLYIKDDEGIVSVVNFFEFRDFLLRKNLISYGGILFRPDLSDRDVGRALVLWKEYLDKLLHNEEAHKIAIQNQSDRPDEVMRVFGGGIKTKTAALKLGAYENVYAGFDKDALRLIKRSESSGVEVEEVYDAQAIKRDFYPVYSNWSRKHHGTPAQPLSFFMGLYEFLPDHFKLFIAKKDGKTIGAFMGFFTKQRMFIVYVPCLKKYFKFRANILLYDRFIKWSCEQGFQFFDIGSVRNWGKEHFVGQLGAKFEPAAEITLPVPISFVSKHAWSEAFLAFLWKYFVPEVLADRLGPLIRRRIGR